MSITATELKNNLSKYIKISQSEDVYVTQHGKIVSKLSNPYKENVTRMESLFGTLPESASLEEATEERVAKL